MRVNTFILGETPTYLVIAPVVVVRHTDRGESYVYKGGLLPRTVDLVDIERLLKRGMIEAAPR